MRFFAQTQVTAPATTFDPVTVSGVSGTTASQTVSGSGDVGQTPAVNVNATGFTGGTKKWEYVIGGADSNFQYSSPAIANDGTIYTGHYQPSFASNRNLIALNPDGTQKWGVNGAGLSNIQLMKDGTIITTGATYSDVIAVNPDSTTLWNYNAGGDILSPIKLDENDNLYFIDNNNQLQSINKLGQNQWSTNIGGSANTLDLSSNTLYYVTNPNANSANVVARNLDSSVKWTYTINDTDSIQEILSTSSGDVYIATSNDQGTGSKLYALNSAGTEKYIYSYSGSGKLDVLNDGTVILGYSKSVGATQTATLQALKSDGSVKWTYNDNSSSGIAISSGHIKV